MMKVVHSLPDIYIEENEYRFAKSNLIDKQIKLPEKCYKEIILGNFMSKADKELVINIAKQSLPNCRILQQRVDLNTEEITFIDLI